MSAEAYREEERCRKTEPELVNIKRNPYLVDYEQQRKLRENRGQRIPQRQQAQERQKSYQRTRRIAQRAQDDVWEQETRRAPRRAPQSEQEIQRGQETRRASRRAPQRESENQWGQETRRAPRRLPQREQEIRTVSQRTQRTQQAPGYERISRTETVRRGDIDLYPDDNTLSQTRKKRAAMEKRRAAARRKRIVRMQRMVLFAGVFCITLLCGILYMKRIDAKTAETDNKVEQPKITGVLPAASSSGLVQGLPAAEFARHPEWEENFLTPNEYSRPGDDLEEVSNIFVHYTANPNTSAAQNRSYFEQLKDTHVTSASAHFIIGYNGEIVQCIPLDEIAYAVQTRNFDSVSIECCYKSADGSFTQETYDSLIELLAWLTDIYDLTTDDILRHYDCGGKKCPIYYTEHEDAWERLKKDVGEKL